MISINKNNKWRVVSLFTGIGAWEKAMSNLDINYDLVHFSEIDKWATTSYCSIHKVSKDLNLGDITEIKHSSLKDFDILFYSPPCFRAGTLITTNRGLIPIESVNVGDMVLTHKNTYRKVTRVMQKYSNDIREVTISSSPSTFATKEHPYYVRTFKKSLLGKNKLSKPYWKNVENLKKSDYLGIPINIKSINKKRITVDEAYNLGKELADSKVSIHQHILDLPASILIGFANGYFTNKKLNNVNKYSIATYNKKLALQLGQIVMKAYRVSYQLSIVNEVWNLEFYKERNIVDVETIDDIMWYPLEEVVSKTFNEDVYNLEVEKDNSYVANGVIVHNCQAFSFAGKQLGFDDERGILFFDALKIIKEKKPMYAMMENVKGLTSKKFKNELSIMLKKLEEAGYNNYWNVLNAKNYGIPQNRERVFIISIRKDIDDGSFKFPAPFDNGLRLKDLLEDSVDEKYYINDERTKGLIEEIKNKNQDISYCIDANYHKGTTPKDFLTKSRRQLICIPCLTPDRIDKRQNGRRFKTDGEPMFTITAQDRHGVLLGIHHNNESCINNINENKIIQLNNPNHFSGRIYSILGISPTITAGNNGGGKEPCKILESVNPNELVFIGGIGEKDWAGDGKGFSRNFPQGNRVYDSNGIACSQTSQGGGIGSFTGLYLEKFEDDNTKIAMILNCSCGEPFLGKKLSDECPFCGDNKSRLIEYLKVKDIINTNNTPPTINETNKLMMDCRLRGGVWDKVNDSIKRVYSEEGISPTISTCQGGHREPKVIRKSQEFRIRKLTPLECWRLMGFDDSDYIVARKALETEYYNGNDRSNSKMYKQAGNSIVVNVVEEILKMLPIYKEKDL